MVRASRFIGTVAGGALICLALAPIHTRAQDRAIPADVAAALTKTAAFTAADLDSLQAGRVITRTEASPENLEASVVAAVRIGTTKERTLDYFRQLVSYVDGQVTLGFGTFSRVPTESNLNVLGLESGDLNDLRDCQASVCDIRIGRATPDEISRAVDWRAPDGLDRANAWMRRGLAAFASDYLRRGDLALVGHDDHGVALDLGSQWKAIYSRSPALTSLAPALGRYLTAFPVADAPPGVTEELYWDKQHLTGLKPIIGITHLLSQRDPSTPDRFTLIQRQIFASHYIFGSLAVTMILQQEANGTLPATYVVYFNRSRGDLLKGTQQTAQAGLRARISNLGASLQRKVGEEMIEQSAERLLSSMKTALER